MASFLKFFILFWNSNVRINKLLNILEYIKINLILNKWVSISQFASNHVAKLHFSLIEEKYKRKWYIIKNLFIFKLFNIYIKELK